MCALLQLMEKKYLLIGNAPERVNGASQTDGRYQAGAILFVTDQLSFTPANQMFSNVCWQKADEGECGEW
ncbi:MAG: hypothetical protein AAF434_17120 [Pseudomonadota bacterium]